MIRERRTKREKEKGDRELRTREFLFDSSLLTLNRSSNVKRRMSEVSIAKEDLQRNVSLSFSLIGISHLDQGEEEATDIDERFLSMNKQIFVRH